MFNPNLDLGNDWEDVDIFSVQPERFNYQRHTNLNLRADALLVVVSTTVANVDYKYGGELFQYWEVGSNKYQVAYSKLWFNSSNVIAIEPLSTSKLLYRPPTYLYNWTIDIKARPYQDTTVSESDMDAIAVGLDKILFNINLLSQRVEELHSQSEPT